MVQFSDLQDARKRIAPYVHVTPVLTSSRLDGMVGAHVFFKCENFQRVGAFKARGAHNAVFSLSDAEAARGVVTHSSGNHAAALALAAKRRGIPATIVMPTNAPKVKKAAVLGYGAKVVDCEPTVPAREATAQRVIDETGGTLIHPYDNDRIIAGQGTAALELFEQAPALDLVLSPVGGGGLLSGTALAAKGQHPPVPVFGIEPAAADDAFRSFQSGTRVKEISTTTIADGLRTTLGERNFALIKVNVDQILTVSEESIVAAMRAIWETMKLVVEPSGAVPFAALLEKKISAKYQKIGVIISGGNVDLDALPWVKK